MRHKLCRCAVVPTLSHASMCLAVSSRPVYWRCAVRRLPHRVSCVEGDKKRTAVPAASGAFRVLRLLGAFSEKETLSLPSNFFTYSAIAQILEIDGTTVLAQSYAILRYCGAVSGLHPSDLVGAAKVDEILYALMEGASLCEPCMFS